MNTFGRRLTPWGLLRPKRAGRLARNALILYVLSRPLRRTINSRRQELRRRYAGAARRDPLSRFLSGLRGF